MDIRSAFVAHPQAAELMQPSDGALDHPASGFQAAAVFGVATGNLGAMPQTASARRWGCES